VDGRWSVVVAELLRQASGIWISLAVASCFETKIMRAGRVAFGKVESF